MGENYLDPIKQVLQGFVKWSQLRRILTCGMKYPISWRCWWWMNHIVTSVSKEISLKKTLENNIDILTIEDDYSA